MRNVSKEEVKLIKLPPEVVQEDRGEQRCKVPFLVVGSTSDAVSWKNDRLGISLKCDSLTVELEKSNGQLITALGSTVNFPFDPSTKGFIIDWRQHLNGGVGCYKVKVSYDISGVTGSYYYGAYNLQNYSSNIVANTTRLYVVLNDFVESTGIDYRNSGFGTTIRFKGKFGYMQPNYDSKNIVLNDREVKKVRNLSKRTYELRTDFINSCFTEKIDLEHLLVANQIYVTDHNATNHVQKYFDKPVILDDEQSPTFEYNEGVLAKVVAYFKDKTQNVESKYSGDINNATNIIDNLPVGVACADGFAVNSDGSYSLAVPSGTTEIIADTPLNLNGNNQGSTVSVKAVNVNLVDSNGGQLGYLSSNLLGNDLEIELINPATIIADMFEARVLSDGGTFEAKQCLIDNLQDLL